MTRHWRSCSRQESQENMHVDLWVWTTQLWSVVRIDWQFNTRQLKQDKMTPSSKQNYKKWKVLMALRCKKSTQICCQMTDSLKTLDFSQLSYFEAESPLRAQSTFLFVTFGPFPCSSGFCLFVSLLPDFYWFLKFLMHFREFLVVLCAPSVFLVSVPFLPSSLLFTF